MNKKEYGEYIKKFHPKENKLKKYLVSFIIGGIVGILGQFLIDFYIKTLNISFTDASGFMMITLIFFSCLFTAIGFFDTWVMKAGAGLFIPISGFAHATTSSAIDYRKEGAVFGIGANIFKLSGSVLLYGTVSAFVFGLIRFVFFGG